MRPCLSFLGLSTPDATVLGAYFKDSPTTDESTTNNRLVRYELICTHCRFKSMHYKKALTLLTKCPRCRCKWVPFNKEEALKQVLRPSDLWHGHFTMFHLAGRYTIYRGRAQEGLERLPQELRQEWIDAGSRISIGTENLVEFPLLRELSEADSALELQGLAPAPPEPRKVATIDFGDAEAELLTRNTGLQGHRIEDVPENLGFLNPPIEMNWTLVRSDHPPEQHNSIAFLNPNYYWVYKTDAVEIGSDEKLFDF